MFSITYADIIMAAFMNVLQFKDIRMLRVDKIEQYGRKVTENLNRKQLFTRFELSKLSLYSFIAKNNKWFSLTTDDQYVILSSYVTIEDLENNLSKRLNKLVLIELNKRKNVMILG